MEDVTVPNPQIQSVDKPRLHTRVHEMHVVAPVIDGLQRLAIRHNATSPIQRRRLASFPAIFASWVKYLGHAITDEYGPGQDYLVKQYLQFNTMK